MFLTANLLNEKYLLQARADGLASKSFLFMALLHAMRAAISKKFVLPEQAQVLSSNHDIIFS